MTTPSKTKKVSSLKRSKKSPPSSKNIPLSREEALSPFVRRFIKRVQNTVSKFDLWQKGDSFVVCVSGGPDSLCLLDVLALLQKKHQFTLHIAHVNYHLREKDSDLDEKLVKEAARAYALPSTFLSRKKQSVHSSEETLRNIRYTFFETVREKSAATHIAVAHNQDDQAETLLMRLLRGAGLSGLAAMRPKNRHIIRPLIEMSRADIVRYLKERQITFREDKSNSDPAYFRNKVRHKLIPFLEKDFQPQTRKLLAETALLLGEDYALLQSLPTALAVQHGPLAVEFSSRAILLLPPARIHQEIRTLLRPFLAGKSPDKNLIHELVKAIRSTKSKNQTLTFQGLKFVRKGDIVRLLNF